MIRTDIINVVGRTYLSENIENGEYSFPKAYKEKEIKFKPIKVKGKESKFLDLRFSSEQLSVLIETKPNFNKNLESAKLQLSSYVQYEKKLTGNNVIAILANTEDDEIMVWKGTVSDENYLDNEYKLKSFDEYLEYYTNKTNDKEKVMKNTYELNELLHSFGIREKLRSQFVGTCLLTLKYSKADLTANNMNTDMIRGEMKRILGSLLQNDLNRASKVSLLDRNVLDSQDVSSLESSSFRKILQFIKDKILPFINDKSTVGQDLLNLFFITFNKYVGKEDKNQAFTPDHITDFMTKITGVNRHSHILDPCCGSGSFLVRAMTEALSDCSTGKEQSNVKSDNIFGIEYDENIYGLATTNMLIHGDGNSNIRQGSCFELGEQIKKWRIDIILMNPPYNATKNKMPKEYTDTWSKKTIQDPSKGFYFVKQMTKYVSKGKLAVLLPMACAIGSNSIIKKIKIELLRENTLDAVFSLPNEIFYPGASSVVCCMLFTLGKRHDKSKPTFFGYYKDDGFFKKKNLGRIEKVDKTGLGSWSQIEKQWLDLFLKKEEVVGLSALKCIEGKDEWLAEAYMKTDFSKLTNQDFQRTISNYLAYIIQKGKIYES